MSNTPDTTPDVPEELGDERIRAIYRQELGDELGDLLTRARQASEQWETARRPDEGLRERKRRLTRQRISDVATTLFATRGFDNVRVSEVADIVGVSEKTVYNYFPTKEAMVLDQADEVIERLAQALRDRDPSETVVAAAVRHIKDDMRRFQAMPEELLRFLPKFLEMIESTAALRAAWLDVQTRVATVAAEELARRADIDPNDPEPRIAGRAIAGLGQVAYEARLRYIERGLRGEALEEAVKADLDRAARLLETGLWSFDVLAQGGRSARELQEAAKAVIEAGGQVARAIRQARTEWRRLRAEADRRHR